MKLGITVASILLFIGIAICTIFILIPKKTGIDEKKSKNANIDGRNKDSEELYKLSDAINATLLDKYNKDLASDTIEEASERISKSLFADDPPIIYGTKNSTSYGYSYATGYLSGAYGKMSYTVPRWDRDPIFIKRNMHNWQRYIQFYLESKSGLMFIKDDAKIGDIAYIKEDDWFYILNQNKEWVDYTSDNYQELWCEIDSEQLINRNSNKGDSQI